MAIKNLELAKLSLDVYNGVQVNFNNVKGEDAIRNALVQSVGGEWNYYNFQKNKWDFYQVLTDVLTLPMQQTIEVMFDGLVEPALYFAVFSGNQVFKMKSLNRGQSLKQSSFILFIFCSILI